MSSSPRSMLFELLMPDLRELCLRTELCWELEELLKLAATLDVSILRLGPLVLLDREYKCLHNNGIKVYSGNHVNMYGDTNLHKASNPSLAIFLDKTFIIIILYTQ